MKNKLRKITIKGIDFLWTHQFKYEEDVNRKYNSISTVTIYKDGYKNGLLLFKFKTWEDVIKGNPLNIGTSVDSKTQPINLNKPQKIRTIIEFALQNGWDGQKRMTIENGFVIFISDTNNNIMF